MVPVRVTPHFTQPLKIGTRGSELALCQAVLLEEALAAAFPGLAVQRCVIHTTGDKKQDLRLGQPMADKGVFTKELEAALASGEIDVAVHSLKDVPTEIDPAFLIAATLPRANAEEVLFTKSGLAVEELPAGSVIATSSARRARQLLWLNPGLRIAEIRGNVPTRVRKFLENDAWQGLMLARAGLDRLGYPFKGDRMKWEGAWLHAATLSAEKFYPAVSQGAIGLEIRSGDEATAAVMAGINHLPTFRTIIAERQFLHLLQAGCHTPVGVHTTHENGVLTMKALVFDEKNLTREPQHGQAHGTADQPLQVAAQLQRSLATSVATPPAPKAARRRTAPVS